MSIARHHAEWLSLVEANGPFISLKVLMEAFPQGLNAHDSEHFRILKQAYEEWQTSQESLRPDIALHRAWVKFVLRETLSYPNEILFEGQKLTNIRANFPEHGETLQPDFALVNPDDDKPRLLVQIFPSTQDLEKRLAGSRWSASPATRMMELLHSNNVRLGLITNGQHWMLVNAPRGETTGFISWYSNLWAEDAITLRAFRSLLSVERFFGVDESKTIESLLAKSIDDQQEVTDQLGYQVRKAVEVLVQKFDRIDKDKVFSLKEIGEKRLYQAALTVMMRLVFMFCAEEKGLFPANDERYSSYYAISTLRAQLREVADQHGEEVLERRSDAWARLLAIFRAVHSGIQHDLFSLPAYGGSLFDPDKFQFLEGRPIDSSWKETLARPIPVDNRTVLHLLEALQILQVKLPGGGSEPRRLSFAALNVEQIGHVYEGLLDHTTVRASSPVLGLDGTKDKEPEVLLDKLEQLKLKSEDALLEFLRDETGRSASALKKALSIEIPSQDAPRFLVACDNDRSLWEQVRPFAGLVRKDTLGYPVVINAGSVYVTQGEDRRSTGTHYTPRSLTEPIVQYTLEPIVYVGVAEGKPKEEWQLKPASELLKLKVCDFAMGSGAFLVQACRYLAERLVESWEESEREHPGQVIVTPEGELSMFRPDESIIPKDPSERIITAKRIVADRCLYGVDKNPMAVEMAKLSLWLETMQQSRPFTFLDHSLKCGDSLLGVTNAEQIKYFNLQPEKSGQHPLVPLYCEPLLQKAIAKRQELEGFAINDINDVQRKEQLFLEAEEALNSVRFLGDLLIGEALKRISKSGDYVADELSVLSDEVKEALDINNQYQSIRLKSLQDKAKRLLGNRKPFHWLLEFPEVFWAENGSKGFDAIVGNPPFMGGGKISDIFGMDYREYLVEQIAFGQRGGADFCAYFFLKGEKLLCSKGDLGLLATNTIAQGNTREVGLDQLNTNGCVITRAISSCKWPGTASLEIASVWLYKGHWLGEYNLDGQKVSGISSLLTIPRITTGHPYELKVNKGLSFKGSEVYGMGYILSCEEAFSLINKDPKNKDVLHPYLNGEDLNSHPNQSPSRWVINFKDWPLNKETTPIGYNGKVANDYPDCLEIIVNRAKPERDKLIDGSPSAKERAKRWWQFSRPTIELYKSIAELDRVLVVAQTSRTLAFSFVPKGLVYSMMTIVFALQRYNSFAILQSAFHDAWVRNYASTMKEDTRYTSSDVFETFPFPKNYDTLDDIGEKYYNHRQSIMLFRQEGLTKTYNRFHNPNETSADIAKLRQLHKEMDEAVANAYGWGDLDLGHGFHQTKQGIRYTICEGARREVLDRLLELNHQRYAEEVAAGLHDKKKAAKASSKGKQAKPEEAEEAQGSLF